MTARTPIHDHGCPVCERWRQATADVPRVRLRTPSPARRWFEAALYERFGAT